MSRMGELAHELEQARGLANVDVARATLATARDLLAEIRAAGPLAPAIALAELDDLLREAERDLAK